ncbi:phosphatase 2C-like domain-containing protein [Dichotomocladium elegans]|nr:phosphatase 2C-like domain-containing protein [Dichotomocladium elegans]
MSSGQSIKRAFVTSLPAVRLLASSSFTRLAPRSATATAACRRLYYDYAIHHHQSPPPPLTYRKTLPLFDFFAATKPKPSYQFTYGATGFAKRGRPTHHDSSLVEECYRSVQVGEDAYIVRSDALGVADGVGGWAGTLGANPALYSRTLMHHAYLELERFDNVEDDAFARYNDADPVDIIQRSYDAIQHQHKGILGSTTACLALLRDDELRIANLGDCGISAFDIKVEKDDIIIMGTDGLYDNLFDRDILSIVRSHVNAYTIPGDGQRSPRLLNFNPQKLSDALAARARSVSEDRRNIDSPFQTRAINEGYLYQGGKSDDISVLVAIVRDSEDSPDRRL